MKAIRKEIAQTQFNKKACKQLAINKRRELSQRGEMRRQNALVDKEIAVKIRRAERAAFRTLRFLAGVSRDLRDLKGATRRRCHQQLLSRGL